MLPVGSGQDGKSPVFVAAGTLVIFHFFVVHKRKDLWGPDADDFRPERWEDEKVSWVSVQSIRLILDFSIRVKANVKSRNFCLSEGVREIALDVSLTEPLLAIVVKD